jgi:hypothetical protein
MFADPDRYNRTRRAEIHRKVKRQNEIMAELDSEMENVQTARTRSAPDRFDFFDPYTPE